VDALAEERILITAAVAVGQAGMIRRRRQARAGQPCAERVDLAARDAVDDARLTAVARDNLLELPLQRAARERAVQQVRPVEGADQLQRIAQRELRGDVAP